MTFPQIVGMLMQADFESYCIDYRRAKAIYYRPDGDSVELATDRLDVPVAGPSTRPPSKPRSARRNSSCRATPTRAFAER